MYFFLSKKKRLDQFERARFTFLCKSNRGLESQNPVLAMVTSAGGQGSVSGRCSYLSTVVGGGLKRIAAAQPEAALINAAGPHWLERGTGVKKIHSWNHLPAQCMQDSGLVLSVCVWIRGWGMQAYNQNCLVLLLFFYFGHNLRQFYLRV